MTDSMMTWNADGVAAWAAADKGEPVVLVHSLRGFIDAGGAGATLAERLLEDSEPIRIASFDIDALLDYRSRRPEMVFSVNTWTDYDEPHLDLDMLVDRAGRAYLFLHGSEPDLRWEHFVRTMRDVVQRMGVTMTVGAHGIPMAVPHTRDILATTHGTSPDLLPDGPSAFGTVTVPASAHNLMEYRFGQWGLPAVNVAVHVPHYLAQSVYPRAAVRALAGVESLTGLDIGVGGLTAAAEKADLEVTRQTEGNDDVQALVKVLEEQYDSMTDSRSGIVPLGGTIPTAEELGAEFERFLADQRREGPPNL